MITLYIFTNIVIFCMFSRRNCSKISLFLVFVRICFLSKLKFRAMNFTSDYFNILSKTESRNGRIVICLLSNKIFVNVKALTYLFNLCASVPSLYEVLS